MHNNTTSEAMLKKTAEKVNHNVTFAYRLSVYLFFGFMLGKAIKDYRHGKTPHFSNIYLLSTAAAFFGFVGCKAHCVKKSDVVPSQNQNEPREYIVGNFRNYIWAAVQRPFEGLNAVQKTINDGNHFLASMIEGSVRTLNL